MASFLHSEELPSRFDLTAKERHDGPEEMQDEEEPPINAD
jgi:hypothetical protein